MCAIRNLSLVVTCENVDDICPVNAYDMRVMLSGISEAGAKDILNALAEEFGVKWIIDEIGVDYILNEIGEEEIKSHFDKS